MAGFWEQAKATGASFTERLRSYFRQQPVGKGKRWRVYPASEKAKAWEELAAQGSSRQGTLSTKLEFREQIECAFGSAPTFAVPKDKSGHATRAHRESMEGEFADEWIMQFDDGKIIAVSWSYDDPDPRVKQGRWTVTGTKPDDVKRVREALKGCKAAGVKPKAQPKARVKASPGMAKAAARGNGYRGPFDVSIRVTARYESDEDKLSPRRLVTPIRRAIEDRLGSTDFAREVFYERIGRAEFPPGSRLPIDFKSVRTTNPRGFTYETTARVDADVLTERSLSAREVGSAIRQALESQLGDDLAEILVEDVGLRGDLEVRVSATARPAGAKKGAKRKPAKRKPAKKRAKKRPAAKKGTVKARARRPR